MEESQEQQVQDESPLGLLEESQSIEQQEAESKLNLLDQFDGYVGLRIALQHLAKKEGHWAGIPMPVKDLDLVIEPKYPYAEKLVEVGLAFNSEQADQMLAEEGIKIRNILWSTKHRVYVAIYERGDKIHARPITGSGNKATMELDTMLASEAWGLEQESKALGLLATLLPHHMFKRYLLTGSFLESSKKSGISYIFRKLRPTIALTSRKYDDTLSILCTLCMHPIGYYSGSWAGVMCPTDDVVAHLMMMRGDERKFWSMCNQHPPHLPSSGL